MIAEGARPSTREVTRFLRESDVGFEVRLTVLGHLQRGGSPTAFDRLLATRMGVRAVELLLEGESGEMVTLDGREISHIPIELAVGKQRSVNRRFVEIAKILD